nr:ADP-ribosylation factor-binding protein GGA1-like [Pelodiscus sinensis]|eukprot:XP_025038345.1 ADP-ribosylation factor-binding protein GGA1-like [Pelodiscus sinensis]
MEPDALESRINKATNPLNKDLDWDSINAFCDQLNKELEGVAPLCSALCQVLPVCCVDVDAFLFKVCFQFVFQALPLSVHGVGREEEWCY